MSLAPPAPSARPATYTPGHAGAKLAFCLAGLVLLTLGIASAWTPLRLVWTGQRARVEAVRVVKEKDGLPPVVLTDDAKVRAALEPGNRSYVFWNEFTLRGPNGRTIDLRLPVGSHLKPLYALVDDDGLPTTQIVFFDPADPSRAVFPFVVSTWLISGQLIAVGAIAALFGGVLRWWAPRPIVLPHVP